VCNIPAAGCQPVAVACTAQAKVQLSRC
jgi:hypothetical protein